MVERIIAAINRCKELRKLTEAQLSEQGLVNSYPGGWQTPQHLREDEVNMNTVDDKRHIFITLRDHPFVKSVAVQPHYEKKALGSPIVATGAIIAIINFQFPQENGLTGFFARPGRIGKYSLLRSTLKGQLDIVHNSKKIGSIDLPKKLMGFPFSPAIHVEEQHAEPLLRALLLDRSRTLPTPRTTGSTIA